MRLIGFTGLSGSGKSTAAGMLAAELASRGYIVEIWSFATELKRYARILKGWNGIMDDGWRLILQWMVDKAIEFYPDSIIESVTTPLAITKINGRWHTNFDRPEYVLIPDVRRENEAKLCLDCGKLVGIQGTHKPLPAYMYEHNSENGIQSLINQADFIIEKQPSLEALKIKINEVAEMILSEEKGDNRNG